MKSKKVIINFKDIRTALDDFVDTAEALSRGESVKQEKGIYFTSIEAFRKAITPRRLELLNIIRNSKPESIHQLASLAHRNIMNVAGDVKLLSQIGLVETRESRNRIAPEVDYDEIDLRIAF